MSYSDRRLPAVADLYGELQLTEPTRRLTAASYIPGLVFVSVVALAALWLSEHYGPPAILMGLLIGLALNFVNADKRLSAGLDFASKTVLRFGIVLIGMRITFSEISSLGVFPFLALVGIIILVLLTGVLAAKLFKQSLFFGLLVGGATAICGASAALALWGLIGEDRVEQSRFTIVLLGTTLASALAMTFYPTIASFLELSDEQAGFLIGASVHDVAQAIGGGFSYSPQAGEVAAVVKLSRVTLLAPVLVITAMMLQKFAPKTSPEARRKIGLRQVVPWFISGFILTVAINSIFTIPSFLLDIGNSTAGILLLFAVIAAAIKSNMSGLLSYGFRSFSPVIVTTLISFAVSLVACHFI